MAIAEQAWTKLSIPYPRIRYGPTPGVQLSGDQVGTPVCRPRIGEVQQRGALADAGAGRGIRVLGD
jgi:hypothetical protein